MFEPYTDSSRLVLFRARTLARERGSSDIRPEHILLSLLDNADGEIKTIFTAFSVSLPALRHEVEQVTVPRSSSPPAEIPLTEDAKKLLAYASHEAEGLRHRAVKPSHLLLGMLRLVEMNIGRILVKSGLEIDLVRQFVAPPSEADIPARNRTEIAIIWDPELVDPLDYAHLVKAIGDLVRAAGAAGIVRVKTTGVEVAVTAGALV